MDQADLLELTAPIITPEIILKLGSQLGVQLDDAQQLHLLSIARLLLTLPLPVNWAHAINVSTHQSVYIDKRTGLTHVQHPNLPKALALVREKQQQQYLNPSTRSSTNEQQTGSGSSLRTCMEFKRDSGSAEEATEGSSKQSYFYDFAQRAEVEGPLPVERIMQPPDLQELVQAGLVHSSPTDTKRLRFYSWWYEDWESNDLTLRVSVDSVVGGGIKRRYATVDFDLQSQTFSITSVVDNQELAVGNIVAVRSKLGEIVKLWDLHVGATLVILGRPVTLMKADMETSLWHEHYAKKLAKLKAELQKELQKYKPRAHKARVTFDRGDRCHPGGLALGYTVSQIHEMLSDLQQYRPQKAEALRAQIPISL